MVLEDELPDHEHGVDEGDPEPHGGEQERGLVEAHPEGEDLDEEEDAHEVDEGDAVADHAQRAREGRGLGRHAVRDHEGAVVEHQRDVEQHQEDHVPQVQVQPQAVVAQARGGHEEHAPQALQAELARELADGPEAEGLPEEGADEEARDVGVGGHEGEGAHEVGELAVDVVAEEEVVNAVAALEVGGEPVGVEALDGLAADDDKGHEHDAQHVAQRHHHHHDAVGEHVAAHVVARLHRVLDGGVRQRAVRRHHRADALRPRDEGVCVGGAAHARGVGHLQRVQPRAVQRRRPREEEEVRHGGAARGPPLEELPVDLHGEAVQVDGVVLLEVVHQHVDEARVRHARQALRLRVQLRVLPLTRRARAHRRVGDQHHGPQQRLVDVQVQVAHVVVVERRQPEATPHAPRPRPHVAHLEVP